MKLKPDPIMAVLLISLGAAVLVPARGGVEHFVDMTVPVAIMALFFLHGLRIPRAAILNALMDLKLQLTVLGCTFIMYPFLGLIASKMGGALGVSAGLGAGLLFLTLVPTTVNTSVTYVGLAKGNVAGAVTATALSNMLAVFLTPILVMMMFDFDGSGLSFELLAGRLEKTIRLLLVPFVAGHLMRRWLVGWSGRHKEKLVLVDRAALGILIYAALSAAIMDQFWSRTGVVDLMITVGIVAGILMLGSLGAIMAGRFGGFDRSDRAALFFCGGQKTMIAGIPMAQILLPAELLGEVIVPMIIFHQLELVLASLMVARFQGESGKLPRKQPRKQP